MASNLTLPASALHRSAEYERSYWHVVVDDTITLDDLMRPAFWAHHANKLQRGHLVDVVRSDMTLDVQLRVLEAGVGFVVMRPRIVFEDEGAVAERQARAAIDAGEAVEMVLPEQYKITHTGRGGFTVTYVPTDAKIVTGKKTRAEAYAAAKDHAQKAGIAWPDAKPVETVAG